jgi:carotenoid cleavage dioxygenase-like enzyme
MLYSFEIGEGVITWRQRFMDSEVARAASKGAVPFAQFGTPNGRSWLQRLLQPVPVSTDNANVSIVPLGDRWLAMTETSRQLLVDPDSLRVTGRALYRDALPGTMWMTAHPLFDRRTRSLVNIGTVTGLRSSLVVYEQASGSMERRELGRWSPHRLPYVHSFGLCDSAAVILGHPFDVDPRSLLWSNDFVEHYQWRPDQGTRLAVLDRRTGEVSEYEAAPMFVFHTVNTFRDGAELVLDVLAYADASVIRNEMRIEVMKERCPDLRARLTRIRLTPGRRQATTEVLSDGGFEFPTIDKAARAGERHGVVWGAEISPAGSAVVRADVDSGHVKRYKRDGLVFGEPVFVRRPDANAEGDGVLLSVDSSATERRTELHVIDAHTLEPLAEACVAVATPLGFHGAFKSRFA